MFSKIFELGKIAVSTHTKGLSVRTATAAMVTALLCVPNVAEAMNVQIDFTGQVHSLTTGGNPGAPALDSTFFVGDTVTGSIVYNAALSKEDALQSFTLGINGLTFAMNASTEITFVEARNDHQAGSSAPVRDTLRIGAIASFNSALDGPEVGGLAPDRLQFSLGTQILNTLTNTDLPGQALINALFAVNELGKSTNFLSFGSQVVRFNISSVDPHNISAVPVPAAMPLFGTGLTIMGFIGWRRKLKST